MMNRKEEFQKWGQVHMIGIGGVSMSGLAEVLNHFGVLVTGSDKEESNNTKHLKNIGLNVVIGHDISLVEKSDTVIYTAAIPKTDEEYLYAKQTGKKLLERSEFLGEITRCYQECICISGTHGKTTTTSMIATCFLEALKDPTISVGAYLDIILGNNRTGNSEYFILEACEYVDSFLAFSPKVEVLLNIDNDHLDYFKSIDHIKESFLKFTNCLRDGGLVIANKDDENTKEILKKIDKPYLTYGILEEDVTYRAKNIHMNSFSYPEFLVEKNGQEFGVFSLNVHGQHNIYNALATIATCDYYHIEKEDIKKGLQNFKGAKRRFELIGKYDEVLVFDDYAHHPTEIISTWKSSLEIPHQDTWVVFEPHTFSRTKDHLEEFASVLSLFSHVLLAPIYAAREVDDKSISSVDLEVLIKKKNPNCVCFLNYDDIIDYLKMHLKNGDILITIGAGPINKVGYSLITKD